MQALKRTSSETQGQIVRARESLNGMKNMARRKVKNGEKSPWGQCLIRPVPNGRRRSGFWLGGKNTKVFWHQSGARMAATVWNWSGKTLSPGALLAVLYFSSCHIFPPVYIPFLTKEVSLLYTFHWQNLSMEGIQNGTPFTYLLLNAFNCFKGTVFWIWINHKTRTSSLLSRSNKMHLITLFGLFTDRHDWFPYPFTYFNQWNPYSFIAGDKMSPQTYLGQRYSMSCITRFSPNLSSFLGCPCCTN